MLFPGHFTAGKGPDIHCAGGRMDPRVGQDGTENMHPLELKLRMIHPVARRYIKANYMECNSVGSDLWTSTLYA